MRLQDVAHIAVGLIARTAGVGIGDDLNVGTKLS